MLAGLVDEAVPWLHNSTAVAQKIRHHLAVRSALWKSPHIGISYYISLGRFLDCDINVCAFAPPCADSPRGAIPRFPENAPPRRKLAEDLLALPIPLAGYSHSRQAGSVVKRYRAKRSIPSLYSRIITMWTSTYHSSASSPRHPAPGLMTGYEQQQ